MAKEQFTIAFQGAIGLNTEFPFASIDTDKRRYNITYHPGMYLPHGKPPETNFDVIVTTLIMAEFYTGVLPNEISHRALNKIQQTAAIRSAIKTLKISPTDYCDALATVTTSRQGADMMAIGCVGVDSGSERHGIVLKPVAGSSSEGLVVLKPSPNRISVSAGKAWREFTEHVVKSPPESAPKGANYVSLEDHMAKYGWQVIHNEYNPKQASYYICTPLAPNIRYEYRIITVGGKIEYIHERDRVAVNPNWTGASRGSDLPIASEHTPIEQFEYYMGRVGLADSKADILRLIEYLSKHYTPLFGSYDLFVTEDGKWGLFEFSYQAGSHDMTENTERELSIKLCHAVYDAYQARQQHFAK